MNKKETCYVIVHGVNTDKKEELAHEQNFKEILKKNELSVNNLYNIKYGMLPLWILLIPFLSKYVHSPLINVVSNQLEILSQSYKNVVILAHSNGTHIISRAIEQASVDNIYLGLYGSTLKCRYNFTKMQGKV